MQFYGKCSVLNRLLYLQWYIAKCVRGSMLNKHCVTLPMINKINCCSFANKKWYFEWVWRILSLLFTIPLSRRTRVESIFWTAPVPEWFSSLRFQSWCRRKLERFTLFSKPSERKSIQRPRASPNPAVFEQWKCAAGFTCAAARSIEQ